MVLSIVTSDSVSGKISETIIFISYAAYFTYFVKGILFPDSTDIVFFFASKSIGSGLHLFSRTTVKRFLKA